MTNGSTLSLQGIMQYFKLNLLKNSLNDKKNMCLDFKYLVFKLATCALLIFQNEMSEKHIF